MRTIVALYNDFDVAQDVVEDLVEIGFPRDHVSLVANDTTGRYQSYLGDDVEYRSIDDVTAGEGAGFGAVVGTLTGLAVALIPGVGPVLAAGPLAAALMAGIGAAAGAVTGGVVAGLVDLGVPEEEAEYYIEGVRRGGTMVSARVDDAWVDRVQELMERHNPVDMQGVTSSWRERGWTGYDASTTPLSTVERDQEREFYKNFGTSSASTSGTSRVRSYVPSTSSTFDMYDSDFRSHYQTTYGSMGRDYFYYLPAYRYGYTLANDPLYAGREWSDIEMDARSRWEESHDSAWDDFKDSVQYAWNRVKAGVRDALD